MKLLKTLLIVSVMVLNAIIAGPVWADAGKYIKTPEYTEVTQAISDLINPENSSNLETEAIQQKLADLRFQKYILETSKTRSVCRNETGKTLAIYAQSKKAVLPTLYFLGTGQATDDDLECVGVYFPAVSNEASGTAASGAAEPGKTELKTTEPAATEPEKSEPVVTKFVPGTQLIATANPETGAIEFNVPTFGSFKASEIDWPMPTFTSAEVEAQTPNAPVD